jgi:urea transport system permease protein
VLWVALGGRATLIGPILGTLLVNFGENALSESYPAMWSLMLGASFLACILFLPRGVMGLIDDITKKLQRRKADSPLTSTRMAGREATNTTDAAENPVV